MEIGAQLAGLERPAVAVTLNYHASEAVERLHLPFPILSDERLELTRAMSLPTFETSGMTLLKCFTLVLGDGAVEHVFYPAFPPDRSASDVVAWLARGRGPPSRHF